MLYSKFKCNILSHFLAVNLIILSLLTNSFAATQDLSKINEHFMKFANDFNTEVRTAEDLVKLSQKWGIGTAKDTELFLEKNPQHKNIKMPKLTFKDGKMDFVVEGKSFSFSYLKNDEVFFEVEGKKLKIEKTATFSEIMNDVSKIMHEKEVTVFDFFIQTSYAQAEVALIAYVAVGLLIAALSGLLLLIKNGSYYLSTSDAEKGLDGVIAMSAALCNNNNSIQDKITANDYVEAINKLEELKAKLCAGDKKVYSSCLRIPRVKKCLLQQVKNYNNGEVYNKLEGSKKDLEKNEATHSRSGDKAK